MSKVIMFSKTYPSYHPKAGQSTDFIQKIWTAIKVPLPCSVHPDLLNNEMMKLFKNQYIPKYHTVRKGSRFKVGDKFSPRVWSDIPYRSKQIIIADDIEVRKVFDFEMDLNGVFAINGKYVDLELYPIIARNDGLTEEDMFHWFMKDYSNPNEFKGQIICWNENINY